MHSLDTIVEMNRTATSEPLDEVTNRQIDEWLSRREVELNTQGDSEQDIADYVVSSSTPEEMDFHEDGVWSEVILSPVDRFPENKVELKVISRPVVGEINEEIAFSLAQKWNAKYNGVEMDEINQVISLNA